MQAHPRRRAVGGRSMRKSPHTHPLQHHHHPTCFVCSSYANKPTHASQSIHPRPNPIDRKQGAASGGLVDPRPQSLILLAKQDAPGACACVSVAGRSPALIGRGGGGKVRRLHAAAWWPPPCVIVTRVGVPFNHLGSGVLMLHTRFPPRQSRLLLAGRASGAGLRGGGRAASISHGHQRALLLGGMGDGRRHKYDYAVPPFKKLMAAVRVPLVVVCGGPVQAAPRAFCNPCVCPFAGGSNKRHDADSRPTHRTAGRSRHASCGLARSWASPPWASSATRTASRSTGERIVLGVRACGLAGLIG